MFDTSACGAIVLKTDFISHLWDVHREIPGHGYETPQVAVLPRLRHWPMDYYRRRYRWTQAGLDALDEIEDQGFVTPQELDALIARQKQAIKYIYEAAQRMDRWQ